MHKKFEMNQTKMKGSCQLERKVVTHDSKSDLPLVLSVNDSTDADLKSENSLVFLDFFF